MAALHDETRARWSAYPPEQFVSVVMNGTLREKVKLASLIIHVYTQIIHQFPVTASMRVVYADGGAKAETRLREVFLNLRACIADVQEICAGDTRTLPTAYTTEEYILAVVGELRRYLRPIERWTEAIRTTLDVEDTKVPGFKGKTIGEIGMEIARSSGDISQILDFAESYVEKKRAALAVTLPDGHAQRMV